MTRWFIFAPLLVLTTACAYNPTGTETRSETVSVTQDGDVTTRQAIAMISTGVPPVTDVRGRFVAPAPVYVATPDELCAVAVAALTYERGQGETAPVKGLFYYQGIAAGPDCTGAYAIAGFPLATANDRATRHIDMPRQKAGDEVSVGIDYGCGKTCRGGTDYLLHRRDGQWQVDPGSSTAWQG